MSCDHDQGSHPASCRIRTVPAMASADVCRTGWRRVAGSRGPNSHSQRSRFAAHRTQARRYFPDFQIILIQVKGGYQKAAVQEMERAMLPVVPMKPTTDK